MGEESGLGLQSLALHIMKYSPAVGEHSPPRLHFCFCSSAFGEGRKKKPQSKDFICGASFLQESCVHCLIMWGNVPELQLDMSHEFSSVNERSILFTSVSGFSENYY